MNKKFSTLAVAAMLASAFTAYAGPGDGDVVTYLTKGNNGDAYQLYGVYGEDSSNKLGFLTLNGDDQLTFKAINETTNTASFDQTEGDYTLGGSLWCVNVTRENDGKNPIFDFTNKAYGKVLDVTVGGYSDWAYLNFDKNTGVQVNDLQHVGGEVAGWEFSPLLGTSDAKTKMFGYNKSIYETTKSGIKYYALRSYINENRVATLIAAGPKGQEKIQVAVLKADNLDAVKAVEIKFVLNEAKNVNLTADEFNTVLFTQKDNFKSLTFDKNANNTDIVNPFSANELKAESAEGDFVYLYKLNVDGKKDYLRVDTAYANGFGTKFLTFAFGSEFGKDKANDPTKETYAFMKDQYKFRLNYCSTEDSLSIQVKSAIYKVNDFSNSDKDHKWWSDYEVSSDEFYVRTSNSVLGVDGSYKGEVGSAGVTETAGNTNWVKLQDLEAATESRIVTVGQSPINTHVSFGFGDCAAVQADYTSVADGVYFIKNAKGQYLAHPIYNNGEEAPLFVTVNADEQNVEHMPAYQWIVLKDYNETAGTKEFSPVTLTNREFADAYSGIQLKQSEAAKYMYVGANKISNGTYVVATDSLEFVKVSDASVKDPYLGYKKFTKEELAVNKYTFNYWHPYADDKYLAKSENDSTLTVLNGQSAFKLDTIAYKSEMRPNFNGVDLAYGYEVTPAVEKRIAGLAQLHRTVYFMSLDGKPVKINKENKFNVSSYGEDQIVPEFPVFFKENNQINGKCYFALVEANAVEAKDKDGKALLGQYIYEISDKDVTLKAGVSDYDAAATLKKQLLNETRTSAFAIAADETPLYRRFNSTLEGQAGDDQDTLRFYEKYRNEYLMIEANKNFMVEHIDFLGIDAQDKAQGGLAFVVDTAWVNRGFGNLKPQYLISIDRHDFAGTPGVPCTYEHNHYDNQGNAVDAAHCSHAIPATPGFTRGKFLINFERFANNDKMVGADDYKWAGYVRAGFKEAIVVADTLYILRDEFKNLPNEEIDLAKVASAEVEAKRAWTNAGKADQTADNFLSYRYELAGDQHKLVTWSMRFVDRENAAKEDEAARSFLFESMKDDGDLDIAPVQAAWLKMQNGCLVLSDPTESRFNEVVTGGDDALIFNVEHVCGDKVAVDNENIAVEGVSVVAGNGQVTIMGAAGKNVTITNILGKVIASQVIASDNATIAVPAGIVAVAVEGEAAVKAIVK